MTQQSVGARSYKTTGIVQAIAAYLALDSTPKSHARLYRAPMAVGSASGGRRTPQRLEKSRRRMRKHSQQANRR